MQKFIKNKQIILIILDGWGNFSKYHGNAIKQAKTPTLDFLWENYPKSLLYASEQSVGLPNNQVGNSEVGHTTIGAGRTIDQALVRISKSIEKGDLFKNKILNHIYHTSNLKKSKVHLIGLCSNGGVHSHIDHLIALIKISQHYTNVQTLIHIITDGRDTKPQSAKNFIQIILKNIENYPNITIGTISGRYYSMDRDCRWQRTEKAYNCLTSKDTQQIYQDNIYQVLEDNYKKNTFDEFIMPTKITSDIVEDNDGLIFFNFRPDRMRQLVQPFCDNNFQAFKVKKINNLNITTFTVYDTQLNLPIIFNKRPKDNFLGQVISEKGFKQFRLAETEKYAHVTYFFNGGREEPFPGEDRELVTSPLVETYDLTPKMSAIKITDKLIRLNNDHQYKLIIVNYANADMLGHTGNLWATIESIETVDYCLEKILEQMNLQQTTLLITADHGNADVMLDKMNEPCKSHSKNLVPFIMVNTNIKIEEHDLNPLGSLIDIAPTILDIFNIKRPKEINGESLITKNRSSYVNNPTIFI
jgi:2,3-bisphosphoglycerate-independent phosphoglycerate mutase